MRRCVIMKIIIATAALTLLACSCGAKNQEDMTKEIYFAGGCFWGTEHFFSLVPGVIETEAGYANSIIPDPTYSEVCSGNTGAAETVKVSYDPEQISLGTLLDLYYETIDPTSHNRQGNDIGTQYRTGIYYTDPADSALVSESLKSLAKNTSKPIAIESGVLKNFYPAEEYHQDYLDKNPGGYCHIPARLFELARNAGKTKSKYSRLPDSKLKEKLSPLQWDVTQNAATERPYINEYDQEFRPGIYVDITSGEPLFVSTDKYDSGCGWPAFSKPIDKSLIGYRKDLSHGMVRTEVRAANSGAHLGHVFDDGPRESGGQRYCINSASLRFIPLEKMANEGYADYIKFVER